MMSLLKAVTGPAIDPQGHRLLGLTLDTNEPVFAPRGSGILESSIGGGKTTRGAVPWSLSLLSDTTAAQLIVDSKDGEISAQLCELYVRMGRRVAVIDYLNVRPELAEWFVPLNPFGASVSAYRRDPRDALVTNQTITNTLIEEPSNGETKDRYFRESPREYLELAMLMMLRRNPNLATPGGIAAILSDPQMFLSFAQIEMEEGDPASKSLASSILSLKGHEHFYMHLSEAKRSLSLFRPGGRLVDAGKEATKTHEELIREGYVIFLVGPQAGIDRLGVLYALNILAFTNALYKGAGQLRIIADEYTNTPIKPLIAQTTTLRGYGCEIYYIRQSRSESIRKFGEQETRTLEENAVVKQWFGGFSSIEEASRISQAMGEEFAVQSSLGTDNLSAKTQTNHSLIKQRVLTPAELMAMPPDQQLIHIKGVGFFVARTISQQNIAPYCKLFADNPLEGGRLKPDPKITLVTPSSAGGTS